MIDLGFLSQVAIWLPPVIHGFFFAVVCLAYQRRTYLGDKYLWTLYLITFSALIFRVGYAIFLTTTQYLVWSGQRIGSILIDLPLAKPGGTNFLDYQFSYFTFYAFDRFWLNLIFTLLLTCLFVLFLRLLTHYRARFFNVGEIELGGLLVLLSGWPNGLIFIALSLITVIFLSLYRLIRQKGTLTTLGLPFLVSAGIVLIWGGFLASSFGLGVFVV